MEDLFLRFDIPTSTDQFTFGERILFLGSCFSDEMANRAVYSGFSCESNPLGTIFHPEPMYRFLENVLKQETDCNLLSRDGCWFCWDASTSLSGSSSPELKETIQRIYADWFTYLKKSRMLFVTFGTAWGYHRKGDLKVVANCHKQPSTLFEKRMSHSHEICEKWVPLIEKLKTLNPELVVVFTVSPVRHIRDGLVENNRSKAVLHDAVRALCEQTGAGYFPSYEILIDQLREYRFYKSDRVHPSEEAVLIIWQKFLNCYTDLETNSKVKLIEAFRKFSSHTPSIFHAVEHENEIERRKMELISKIPNVILK
jgi:hypothetical protein